MHVCLDVSPTAQKHAGMGRYAGEIARALAQDHPEIELSLFYNGHGNTQLPDYLTHIPHKSVKVGNKLWRLSILLSQLSRWSMNKTFGVADVFHATNHLLAHFKQARTVYTLHDLIFLHYPEYHLPYNRWYLTLTTPLYLRAADIIVTPSECTRQDVIRFYQLPEAKIKVIYEAAAPYFQPVADPGLLHMVKQKYHLPDRFILHVATIEPRKNLNRLLEVFQSLLAEWPELRLVLVGKKGWLYESFFEKLNALGLQECVIFPGYVDELELPAFYHLAEVFVFPSLYEGFGLGPLEAMACGTPVVSSNSSSLPEIVADAGLLFEPTDTAALATALRQILSNPELSADLRQRGLRQAQRFSWMKAADELKQLYQTLQPAKRRNKKEPIDQSALEGDGRIRTGE